MWNLKDLPAPPNFTYRCTTIDVATLKKACLRAVSVLQDQKQLHSEAALLSRFLYSMKTKFRSDKGFNILGKVNRGLLQYLSLNLHGAYVNFNECVPDPSDPDQYVPSCQMLQYLLVRTQSFARLWCYIISNCQEAGRLLQARMGLGHNWWAAVVGLAITSRIWAYGKYLIVCACEWFSQLKPFLDSLKVNGPPWLPDYYTFPEDLRQWLVTGLQEKNIVLEKCSVKPKLDGHSLEKLFAVSDVNDIEDESGAIEIVDDTTLEKDVAEVGLELKQPSDLTQKTQTRSFMDDVGESVARESLQMPQVNNNNNNNNSGNKKYNVKSVTESRMYNPVPDTNELTSESTVINYEDVGQSNEVCFISNIPNKNKNMDIDGAPRRVKKQKNLMGKKLASSIDSINASQTVKKQLACLNTHHDLTSFIEKEDNFRQQSRKACVSRNLDMLQWNMLKNLIYSYVAKLKKKSVSKDKYNVLIKKARKAIRSSIVQK